MAIEGQEGQDEIPAEEPSLRDSLEAAIEQVEAPAEGAAPSEGQGEKRTAAPEGSTVIDLNQPPVAKQGEQTVLPALDPAPKAWKAGAQKAWASLPAEVRQEVQRREKEISKVFGETGQIRQTVQQFSEIVRPYEARMRSVGLQPLEAVQELLKADHILSTAPVAARAAYMAQLIQEYGVDIKALDNALAGQPVADPVESRLEQMIAERLSPLQAFLANQAQVARGHEQHLQQQATGAIDAMEADGAKFPHFQRVREDMADIIELNARRNVFVTPEQAYSRAVAMNPELGAQQAQQQSNGRQLQQAQAQHARAQRALNASSSTAGAPGGSPVGGVGNDASLRDTIEAAFNQVAGR